jgi:cyclohexadienyl dehydratase
VASGAKTLAATGISVFSRFGLTISNSSRPWSRYFHTLFPGLLILLCSASVGAGQLGQLVEQRLTYMKGVAAFKWHSRLPIENLERERLVLDSAVEHGLRRGLTTHSSRQFFQAQITAAKAIQHYWFAHWREHPESVPASPRDLNSVTRPLLISLGEQIIDALGKQDAKFNSIALEGLPPQASKQLSQAALAVERYPNTLAQVLDSGLLRVATTGDYQPFSYSNSAGEMRGIDIDLAQNLAHSLGVELRWVPTTWPDLMEDFHSGKFDIGMSGISISLARAQTAMFSAPYHRGGKTPIIRCTDSTKYSSMDSIDRPGTRIIVNPGGTNARFLSRFIKKASVRIFPDNRTIFEEILAGRADLMITDRIEVQLQSGIHPQLCGVPEVGTLTFSEKAYLLPQDIVWKHYVDSWLNLRIGEGLVAQVFAQHLPANPHPL